MNSVERIDRLLWLLVNRITLIAAFQYSSFFGKSLDDSAADAVKSEIEDDVELLRVALANGADDLVREATNDVDDYLLKFGVDSEDIDYFKLAHFICIRLAQVGALSERQRKIALMMSVYILDGFVLADTGSSVPKNFVNKMCASIYRGNHLRDYGAYGIYSVFKVASKCIAARGAPSGF